MTVEAVRRAITSFRLVFVCLLVVATGGCGPRVLVVTGTTIGLKATPGDAQTRPPQVTLAYKRAETALVPTAGSKATGKTDAYSTLASFFFETEWFGATELRSFIATGNAARPLTEKDSTFSAEFAKATLGVVPDAIQGRRKTLEQDWTALDEAKSHRILDQIGYPVKPGKTAKQSLQDAIKDAQTDPQLEKLESAFHRVR